MKVLVTYYSQTGNTEKLAHAIYEALKSTKVILPVSEVKDVQGYGLIFIGFPVQAHSVPVPVQIFIQHLPRGQHIAFFSTHGSLRGGHLPRQALEHAYSLAAGAKILGHLGVRGRVRETLLEELFKKVEHQSWVEEARGAAQHPNQADLEDGRDFARRMEGLALAEETLSVVGSPGKTG